MARVLEPAFRVARRHLPDDLTHHIVHPLHRTCSRRAERLFDLEQTSADLDLVNVMSYDASPAFDPSRR